TSALASDRSQTNQITPKVATATASRATSSNHAPSAAATGSAQGAPNGVHARTLAIGSNTPCTVSRVGSLAANDPETPPINGPNSISGTNATMVSTSRERRESSSGMSAVVHARDPITQMATASSPPTSATGTIAGVRHHASDSPATASTVVAPGIVVTPATDRPAISVRRGIPNSTKRCGSKVASTPEDRIGMIHHASTMTAPPTTMINGVSSGAAAPPAIAPTVIMRTMYSAYRQPRIIPIICHTLLRNVLPSSLSRRRTRCATTTVLP